MTPEPPADQPAREHGFSLRSVTWGYRDIFRETIEELYREGHLGRHRREVTESFFNLLKQSDQSCYDHVLRQFLGALSPPNRWIMDLPGIFTDLVDLGATLADEKLYYGIRFFEAIADNRLGDSPEQLRNALTWMRQLWQSDHELAMAFLAGYDRLRNRLQPEEIEQYLDVARTIHSRNAESGYGFLRGELRTAETYIRSITRECRLIDVADSLQTLLRALTGIDCEIADLGDLDSDDLIERGTSTVTVSGHVYLSARCRRFDSPRANRNWYRLCAIASASATIEDSFAVIHGHGDYPTAASLAGTASWRVNLLCVLEYVRLLRAARRRWPGARRLIDWGLAMHAETIADTGPHRLLLDALDSAKHSPALQALRDACDRSRDCFASASELDRPWTRELLQACPSLHAERMGPVAFLPDFLFPMGFAPATSDAFVADLKNRSRTGDDDADRQEQPSPATGEADDESTSEDEDQDATEPAGTAYLYDEWDFQQNDYRPDWCHVHPRRVEPAPRTTPDEGWLEQARKVRAVFERLKPELARREKYLPDGEDINTDELVTHMVDRRRQPSPPVRFYEKPRIQHRDLAVLLLLDVSGSTGETLDAASTGIRKILDVEKQAAVILGQGLSSLGDRFAVCGFSSNGPQQCDFLEFKGFDDDWAEAIPRILAAWPRSSTRIGPALRHAGWLLSAQPHRQRLIILVTDGKPQDQGYDPNTRYAQHDVRMACEENTRHDVHTFGISTEENSLADMEIMFPRRRFVILPDIGQLPRILPQLYLRLTL
ncbi:MAG: nitric oxide reductase activation protein NorD [Planctomycetota bacterium]